MVLGRQRRQIMKILIAIDSFKGSLSSKEAGEAIKSGILRIIPNAEVLISPLADGGEGTVETLVEALGGSLETVRVKGPLFQEVEAHYGILSESEKFQAEIKSDTHRETLPEDPSKAHSEAPSETDSQYSPEDGKLAVMEMSQASGITLLSPEKRNPLKTSSYGVGQMILDAYYKGCRRFLIGIGGSATNDGGIGMLTALGFRFTKENGEEISPIGEGLKDLVKIENSSVPEGLLQCSFQIACDVENPLYGENGASLIYGFQKGGNKELLSQMDLWMKHYSELVKEYNPAANSEAPGSGAAGGLGFAFRSFLQGELKSGVSLILEETKLSEKMQGADLVITGEGRLDEQSAMGKAPIGVAKLAKSQRILVVAFAGAVTEGAKACNQAGIDAYFPILRGISTLEEAMEKENARRNLEDTVEQVISLYHMRHKKQ
ncbi:glycerate kinase [Oribacterium sinus]|uniref:Glycerate kinase n=1 Tax=Oribacterium sinus TaxID=237576 RepID=A0A930GUT8_9FIRM|nr:glycerate kinase [Oribacterium sinus]MBF1272563.1 glycerate kinase [Oribacterium sinus]